MVAESFNMRWDTYNNRTCTSLSGIFNPCLSDRDEDEEPTWWPKSVCWALLNDPASQNENSLNSDLNLLIAELIRCPPRTP